MKAPRWYDWPLMIISLLLAIVFAGWIITTLADMKGERDEYRQQKNVLFSDRFPARLP